MRLALVLISSLGLGLAALAPAFAQTQGATGSGPSYTSPAGRSPTTPATPSSTAVPILPPGGQPNGARKSAPASNEYGTPVPGVTQR